MLLNGRKVREKQLRFDERFRLTLPVTSVFDPLGSSSSNPTASWRISADTLYVRLYGIPTCAFTNLLIGDPFHLVNHTEASLPNAIDDFVFVQFLDGAIAVDSQPLGFAWFSRHDDDACAVEFRLMLRRV
jgi:hypothetical protein